MTMRERLSNSLICAAFALIAGCVTVLIASPGARGTLIASSITALVAFITVLVFLKLDLFLQCYIYIYIYDFQIL